MIRGINFQPAFKGTVVAGPIEEKSSFAQDGVLVGYTIAALEKSGKVSKETKGKSIKLEALVEKIPFLEVFNNKGFEDRSLSTEPRKVDITVSDDSFELVYNYPKEGNWFDKLIWKMGKEDFESKPEQYKTYLGALKSFIDKNFN